MYSRLPAARSSRIRDNFLSSVLSDRSPSLFLDCYKLDVCYHSELSIVLNDWTDDYSLPDSYFSPLTAIKWMGPLPERMRITTRALFLEKNEVSTL